MSVADNLARIRETIGISPVRLIAVTKHAELDAMETAFQLGVTEFGENRLQDALAKRPNLSPELQREVSWHFVGHLQTNKVRKTIGQFSLLHSIDSLRLAKEISIESQGRGLVQPVLLQVKILPDPTKSGFTADQLRDAFSSIISLAGLQVEGLMTITPAGSEPRAWRQCFTGLRALLDEFNQVYGLAMKELSMGMSEDYVEAIKCGATMIRLGRAIFDT